jgi:hypothetical protein
MTWKMTIIKEVLNIHIQKCTHSISNSNTSKKKVTNSVETKNGFSILDFKCTS